jgi:hypothetical protein
MEFIKLPYKNKNEFDFRGFETKHCYDSLADFGRDLHLNEECNINAKS